MTIEPWQLLPYPREVHLSDDSCDLATWAEIVVDERAWPQLETAMSEALAAWSAYGITLAPLPHPPLDADDPLAIIIGEPAADVLYLADDAEAYQINLSPEGALIIAPTAHGLFDGLQTLWQLVDQSQGRPPCGTIVDWPALTLRGVHLDLKGGMAPAAYWREAICRLSRYKINAVLVEYEDKFPYAGHPELAGPGALTREELDALLATARDHFVEVIPLLQCLGHVEYILRHPQYAALRESGDLTQFCPQEPGSLALWRELADEVLAAHPEGRYFHLGADEAWRLGDCPRCRAVADAQGKLALYLAHVNAAADHVRAAGRQPIIWDDMVQRNLDAHGLEGLPDDVILCSWAYGPADDRDPGLYYGGSEGTHRYRWISRQWVERDPAQVSDDVRWLEDAPDAVEAFARRYWDRGEYPLYGAALPWVGYFADQGRAVVGASAAKGADGLDAFCPNFGRRTGNVAVWAATAKAHDALGVIATAWSRYNGLAVPCESFEMGWYTYLASAAFDWEERAPNRYLFDRQFAVCFMGNADSPAVQAIEWLDAGRATRQVALVAAARGLLEADGAPMTEAGTAVAARYLAHLCLAAGLAEIQVALATDLPAAWRQWAHAQAGPLPAGQLPAGDLARLLARVQAHGEALAAWRERAAAVLADTLLPADVRETIEVQCGRDRAPVERSPPGAGGAHTIRRRHAMITVPMGIPWQELDTPALCLDAAALELNIARMAAFCSGNAARLRPHAKTHKSPAIAWMQLRAGAIGITCAKVGEAEVMAAAGIRDILIANQVVGADKIARLVALAAYTDVITAVEDADHAAELSAVACARGVTLRTILEVEVGMGRCGVAPGAPALDLARRVDALPGLRFEGIMGYEGHAVMIPDGDARRRAAADAMDRLIETADLLRGAGLSVPIVSAGGTGTYAWTGVYPGITEIQAGSYATMDGRYRSVLADGGEAPFESALTVVARVISARDDRAVIDAGLKTMTGEFGVPEVLSPAGWSLTGLSEEHGSLERAGGAALQRGDRVVLLPSHGCTTINLHDVYHVLRDGVLEAAWPIAARGRIR